MSRSLFGFKQLQEGWRDSERRTKKTIIAWTALNNGIIILSIPGTIIVSSYALPHSLNILAIWVGILALNVFSLFVRIAIIDRIDEFAD